MIRLIYVAGRYRAPTFEGIAQNISAAREVGVAMAKMGWYPVIPHCNTAHMELNTPEHGDEFWLAGTLEMMTRCDAVVLVPGWESSEGTKGEIAKAEALGLPVYRKLDQVPLPDDFLASLRRKAPWPDYAGNDIFEGDKIRHPDGDEGEVFYFPNFSSESQRWRVSYFDDVGAALFLQVGDKGQAVVVRNLPTGIDSEGGSHD